MNSTPLDLVENFFGQWPSEDDVESLSRSQLQELAARVAEYTEATANAVAPEGTIYMGGWHAGLFGLQQKRDLGTALLYHRRLLLHDPLGELLASGVDRLPPTRGLRARDGGMTIEGGPTMWARVGMVDVSKDPLERITTMLSTVLHDLKALEPLIRDGSIVFRPQWPTIVRRAEALMASVRADVRSGDVDVAVREAAAQGQPVPLWDTLRGLNVVPGTGFIAADERWAHQHESFFLAKTLAVADAAAAMYVPQTPGELSVLRSKGRQLKVASEVGFDLLPEVHRFLLPDVDLSIRGAVRMRQSEESFEDWRRLMRSLSRDARSDTPEELEQRVADTLGPVVERVHKQLSIGSRAKIALKDAPVTIAINATVPTAASLVATGSPGLALATAPVSGVLSWLWKMYRSPNLSGVDAVVAAVHRGT